jgi:hypothetical protein
MQLQPLFLLFLPYFSLLLIRNPDASFKIQPVPTYETVSMQWLRIALSNGPNWVGLSCPIHLRTETDPVSETCGLLSHTYKTMDRVQNKPNSSVQHTPSSESFQVYQFSPARYWPITVQFDMILIGPQDRVVKVRTVTTCGKNGYKKVSKKIIKNVPKCRERRKT